MTKRVMRLTWCLTFTGLMALGACSDKKGGKTEAADKAKTEEVVKDSDTIVKNDSLPKDSLPEEVTDPENIDEDMEGEMMTPEQLEAYENEVWTHLGGTYGFVGEGYEWVALETGLGEDDEKWLSLGGEEEMYPVTIDYKTGNIKAYDDDGNLVFDGYCTKGGNMLRGKLRGKDVKFEGACGQ